MLRIEGDEADDEGVEQRLAWSSPRPLDNLVDLASQRARAGQRVRPTGRDTPSRSPRSCRLPAAKGSLPPRA
jgi:hypothetical protein